MTEGISKEAVERIIKDCNLDYDHHKWLADKLREECRELDPWLPIDENTPKNKRILLSFPETNKWFEDCPRTETGFYNDSFGRSVSATHYKLLPEDPHL